MKRIILVFAVLLIMVSTGVLGHNLMQVIAVESDDISYDKYYTSICLEEGDTLWSLAERYNNHSVKTMEEYVQELKSMNCLIDDTIHAGNYLTVTYYKINPPLTVHGTGGEQ